jgi:hypothetical protein
MLAVSIQLNLYSLVLLRLINRSPEQHAIDAANPGYVSHTSDTFAAMYVDGVNQFG